MFPTMQKSPWVQGFEDANTLSDQSLDAKKKEILNKYLEAQQQSELANRNAMTQLNQQKTTEQNILNKWLPQSEEARIKNINAMAALNAMGGKGGGVGQKEEQNFQRLVGLDNPQLKPEQVYEASNVLREGGDTLADGTKLNPLSQAALGSANRLLKGQTTGAVATQAINANKADAELKVLMNMSQKDFEPYATTYAGFSPQQVIDTFKSDNASQDRLGNFIASQAAQYEAAQIRNRIAGGESGISATQELMGKSGQIIKAHFPHLSARARLQATKRLDEYLDAGLRARNSVGIGLTGIQGINKMKSSSTLKFKPYTQKELEDTAAKYGMSPEEAKKLLGD